MEKMFESKKIEEKLYNLWWRKGFFNPDRLPKRNQKPYSIVLPPPNVTGSLHIGHAINSACQDILIRWKRMQGFKTLWLPGTDHAGIATQNVVEKQLRKEGLTRHDLGREKFLLKCQDWVKEYGTIILNQFKKIGISADWSRVRFTLDKNYVKAIEKVFEHYFKKGWIYRAKRLVNWCVRCHTSLSDLEVDYREEKGKLYYIKYPLKEGGFITVATTRPETMLGDTGVAVNPKDFRYQNFVGKIIVLPLVKREIPIIASELVDITFGTGAIKVTPAHDFVDEKIGEKNNLEKIEIIDEEGKIINAPANYLGLYREEAREKIVQDLNQLGLMEKTEEYTHKIPVCDRCHKTLEVLPSLQWFLKMDELKKKAIEAVKSKKVIFVPSKWGKTYLAWLKNVKDWCISRQIWWGHQIPVWHCQTGKFKVQSSKFKIKENYFISAKKPTKCPICGNCQPERDSDVLDTWFSSALWPFVSLGWPQKTKDLKMFYPTNVLSTGRDIISLWVARMVFSGLEFLGKEPFKYVFIHPTVLTKEGKRMSKSLGTGIDPVELIERYGADATRFGLVWQLQKLQDLRFSEDSLIMAKKFCTKIWNASRFVVFQMQNLKHEFDDSKTRLIKNAFFSSIQTKNLTLADKKIISSLNKVIEQADKNLENFEFGKNAQNLYHFFWHNFCDKYIENFKIQISKAKTQREKKEMIKVLLRVLLDSLKLLHPMMPFITEEIYQKIFGPTTKSFLIIESWPKKISFSSLPRCSSRLSASQK